MVMLLINHPKKVNHELTCYRRYELNKVKKEMKTNNAAGSIMKSKVREMDENNREGRSSRASKEVVVYVQDVAGNKKFPVKFVIGWSHM